MDDNAIQDENAPSLIYEQFGKLTDVNELHLWNTDLPTYSHNGKLTYVNELQL